MADWEIAETALQWMKPIETLAAELGLVSDEVIPYGRTLAKIDQRAVLSRASGNRQGKFIDVTAITPTPLGEGKTTTTLGLVQGLGAIGKRVSGAIRQPSGGPTFNIKGSAAGGGRSQCVPMTEFSLGLTGDIDAITNAHNLAMVAWTSRLQHEFNYSDSFLAKRGLTRLDIDPNAVEIGWAIDFSAQALRSIVIGIGGKMDGFMMRSSFQITVSSEIMAILAVTTDLADFRRRIGRMVVAYNKRGAPVTTADLEVDGAMTALLVKTINPTLMQTIEGQPVLVHAGPFANIAIGQSSIIADRIGLALSEYHVTESGFGADIGFEKFWNLKSRFSGNSPDAAVIVATIRALKMHGGGPRVVPGASLDEVYTKPAPDLVERGVENLVAHIETVKMSGISPVVCINHFPTDDLEEERIVRTAAERAGARVAVSRHWLSGGEGARDLADAVVDACNETSEFQFLYDESDRFRDKVEKIATRVYGADGVTYADTAERAIERIEADSELSGLGPCMVKTHLSLTHDPDRKGRPRGWTLPIRDLLTFRGAGFVVPVAGDIKLMPGTGSDPAYRRIDVDTETGRVRGMF
jgi:formate--tetrahydrofolate ligase